MNKILEIKENIRKPPKNSVKSLQYDLFSQFLSNDDEKVSNTIEPWERIPKFFFTAAQVKKLRNVDGTAKPYTQKFHYKNIPCKVEIHPALIANGEGDFTAFFPGVTEELVEETIKKIFANQQYGIHDPIKNESWVRFSLAMICKELKKNSRQRNISEIKHAIDVMSKTIIVLYNNDEEVWRGAILQDLVTINRKKYLQDTSAQHIARLPIFITRAINEIDYRQYNYERLMKCDEQLARWLYKQLIHRFIQADIMLPYHISFTSLKRDSGLLQQSTDNNNRKKVILAFKELQEQGVLESYSCTEKKSAKKVVDVTYILYPSENFVKEQKAANKRMKNAKTVTSEIR